MKKLISLALALVLVLSMATVAFAANVDDEEPPAETTYTDMQTVTLTKQYTLTNAGTTSPAETFTFSVPVCTNVADGGIVDGAVVTENTAPTFANDCWTGITYASGDAGKEGSMTKTATLTLPTFRAVGKYTYTFTETNNNTAGVSYREGTMSLIIDVIQGENDKVRVAHVHAESANGAKTDTFTNTYSAGSLAVKKVVNGKLADRNKYFPVVITLNGETGKNYNGNVITVSATSYSTNPTTVSVGTPATFYLKHDETVILGNIPYDVTYTVVENTPSDYTASYNYDADGDNNEETVLKIDDASDKIVITNSKDGNVDTGITLDTLPFVLILAVCAGAVVLFVVKRRRSTEF